MYGLLRFVRAKTVLVSMFSICQVWSAFGASSSNMSLKTNFLNNSLVKKINEQPLLVRTAIWGTAALATAGIVYMSYLKMKNGFNFFSNNGYQTNFPAYPISNAPAHIVMHNDGREYAENYNFDEYHHLNVCYPFGRQGRVAIENFNGQVCVETADVNVIIVDVKLEPNVLQSPVRTAIEVDPSNCIATIKTTHAPQPANIAAVMKILVPQATSVDIKTANGRVVASNRIGSTKIRTTNDEIEAHNLTGEIDLQTSNGGVDAKNIHAQDKLSIKTSNGEIYFDLRSATHIARADIQTTNGRIDLSLPRSLSAFIQATTSNDEITGNVLTRTRKNNAAATLGTGAMHMTVKTSNGLISANVA